LVRSEEALTRKPAETVLPEPDAIAGSSETPTRDFIPNTRLQYARFRFWNGTDWQESWSTAELPAGVEVSLGSDPLPEGLTPEEYPFELYRRIIFLPNQSVRRNPPVAEGKSI
jgi:hypothetical protein